MLCVIYYIDQVSVPQPGISDDDRGNVESSRARPNVS